MKKRYSSPQQYYISDPKLFTIWVYRESEKFTGKKSINFYDLIGVNGSPFTASHYLLEIIEKLGFRSIQGIRFNADQYRKLSNVEFEKSIEWMQEHNLLDLNKSFRAVLDNKFNN